MELQSTSPTFPPQNSCPLTCINCCTPLAPLSALTNNTPDFLGMGTPVYELHQSSNVIQVSTILKHIYKLALLTHSQETNAELSEDTPLCGTCANILDRTYLLLQEFDSLRTFDSYLSYKLTQLDEMILEKVCNNSPDLSLQDTFHEPVEIKVEPPDLEEDPETIEQTDVIENLQSAQNSSGNSSYNIRATGQRQGPKRYYLSSDSEDETWNKIPKLASNSPQKRRRKQLLKTRTSPEEEAVPKNDRVENSEEKAVKDSENEPKKIGTVVDFYRRKLSHPFPCVYCQLNFDVESDRVTHLEQTHCTKSKYVICSKCGKLFKDIYMKKYHESQCGETAPRFHLPPFVCKDCGKEFETFKSLTAHGRQAHTDERPYACDQCDYKAKDGHKLKVHEQHVHVVPIKVQCPECPRTLKSEKALEDHIKRQHTAEGFAKYQESLHKSYARMKEKTKEKQANQTTFCDECKIDFFTVHLWIKHRHKVHGGSQWQCEQCGRSLTSKKSLSNHLRFVHTTERHFVCEQCGQGFKSSGNLYNHVKRHVEGEKAKEKANAYHKVYYKRRKLLAKQLAKLEKNSPEGAGTE